MQVPVPQPVQLRIVFHKVAADLADVWGIGEEVRITVRVTDGEELAIAGAILEASIAGDAPLLLVARDDGSCTFSWSASELGEYPVSVEFGGDDDYMPSFESRSRPDSGLPGGDGSPVQHLPGLGKGKGHRRNGTCDAARGGGHAGASGAADRAEGAR